MIIRKKVSEIMEADLESLIDGCVAEGKQIEYKLKLPGNRDKDKKEFLADISSFSNSAGGHLFYGISEKEGLPKNIVGLKDINADKEMLRLENLLRDAINPRLPGVALKAIHLKNGNSVIVIYIPRSWVSPHMVTFGGVSKFYARNSAGKYQLDVFELRSAFTASSLESEKIKQFHAHRIGCILSDETPVQLANGAKIILHIIPVGAIGGGTSYCQMLCMALGGDPFFNDAINKLYSSDYFSKPLRMM